MIGDHGCWYCYLKANQASDVQHQREINFSEGRLCIDASHIKKLLILAGIKKGHLVVLLPHDTAFYRTVSARIFFITKATVIAWESRYIASKQILSINTGTN